MYVETLKKLKYHNIFSLTRELRAGKVLSLVVKTSSTLYNQTLFSSSRRKNIPDKGYLLVSLLYIAIIKEMLVLKK